MAKRFCTDYQLLLLFSAQSCPILCDPMDWSMPGFLILHYLQEFVQPHGHGVGDAIQPSHPLSSHSPALNRSQHQSFPVSWLSASSGQSIGALASVLPISIQDWFSLGLTGLIFLLFRGLWSISSTTVWKHEFFSAQLSLWANSYILTWVLEKPLFWLWGPLLTKWYFCFFFFFYFKKSIYF